MSDLIDDLKGKVGEWVDSLDKGGQVRAAIEGIRRQSSESDRKRQIKRAEAELSRLKLQYDQSVIALGLQTLALYETGKLSNQELGPLCQRTVEMKKEIATLEAELAKLQPAPSPEAGPPCPSCHRPLPAGSAFCPYCGSKVEAAPADRLFCPHCGASLRPAAKFCPACGQSIS